MSLSSVLQEKDITLYFLADIKVGRTYQATSAVEGEGWWTTPSTNIWTTLEPNEVTAFRLDGVTFTQAVSVATLVNNSWYHDGTKLYVQSTTSPWGPTHVAQADITLRFSNISKEFGGRYYQHRFTSIPNFNMRIEQDFQGKSQMGGGAFSLANGDGFFHYKNNKDGWQWDAGTVTFKIGADTRKTVMVDGDYEGAGKFLISDFASNDSSATLQLVEMKHRLDDNIPVTYLTKALYPDINDGDENKPAPIAYGRIFGAQPPCINTKLGQFLLAGHAITSVDSIRIETDDSYEEVQASVIDLVNGTFTLNAEGKFDSATSMRADENDGNTLYITLTDPVGKFPDPFSIGEYKVLLYNYTDYASQPTSDPDYVELLVIESQTSTIPSQLGSALYSANEQFINMKVSKLEGTALPAVTGKEYRIAYKAWNGEAVSVDFYGKTKANGRLMNNAADMVEDLLTTYYKYTASDLNATVFTASEARLEIGYTAEDPDDKVCSFVPSIYITDLTSGMSIINRINAVCGAYFFINNDGKFEFKVFKPMRGADCDVIESSSISNYSESSEVQTVQPSRLRGNYAFRLSEDWNQTVDYVDETKQYLANKAAEIVQEYSLDVSTTQEAEILLEKLAVMQSRPLQKFPFTVPYFGFKYFPGQQKVVKKVDRGLNEVLEVQSATYDYNNMVVNLIMTNRHGFERCGFLVTDSEVLPESLADEVGYGTGSPVWEPTASDVIKAYERQNIAYWMSSGMASGNDPKSFGISRWCA